MTDLAFVDDDPFLREANLQSAALAGLEARGFASAEEALAAIGRISRASWSPTCGCRGWTAPSCSAACAGWTRTCR